MRIPPIPATHEMVSAVSQRQSQDQPPTRIWQDLSSHQQQQIAQVLAEMIRRWRWSNQGEEGKHDDNR